MKTERADASPRAELSVNNGDFPTVGDPDYIFVYDNYPVGMVEFKTFWKVTPERINEALSGDFHCYTRLTEGTALASVLS